MQIETERHAYKCEVCVTIEVPKNTKTPAQVTKEAYDQFEQQIGDCLVDKGLPRADAKKFLRCKGNTLVVRATPQTGNNTGTAENPKKSYEGRLDQQIQWRMSTSPGRQDG